MPTLPDKTALGAPPNPDPNRPIVQLPTGATDPGALALDAVGSGLRDISGIVKLKAREDEDYEVQKALIDFDLAQEKRLDDAKRTAAPEAKDFTANYRGEYDAAARDFMKGVPDRLKPKLDEILVKRGAGFEKRAYDFELLERDRFHIDDVNTRLTEIYNDSMSSPERHAENAQRGLALLKASKLTERAKMKATREFLDKNEEFAIRALADRYAAEGRDVGEIIEMLRRVPRGSWRKDSPVAIEGEVEDFRRETNAKPSVRFNNPGAMYPGPSSQKFGAIGTEVIGGGHKIAVFPDAVSGAAAQFDLLASAKYKGKRLEEVVRPWSGNNNVGTYLEVIRRETGLDRNVVLTEEMLRNPAIAIPLAKAMAVQEAGKPYPLSDAGWQRAHQMAFGGKDYKPPATMDLLDREAARTRQAVPLNQLPDGTVERTELPAPPPATVPKDQQPPKINPETGEIIREIGADQSDIPQQGTLKPIANDAQDEPFEADEVPYRHLSPTTRRRLINVLRTANRAQITTQITDDIERIRLGREPTRGPDGLTVLERAKQILPPIQYRKLQEQWQEAEIEHRAMSPLRSLPVEQMYDHVQSIMRDAEQNEESLRAARKVRDKTEREIEKIRKLRETDPVRSVNGFVGEETDERRPPLPNTMAAINIIREGRKPDVVIGPDGKPVPVGPSKPRLSQQQQWELMFEARLKDQEIIMPDEPERHRIIDRAEAQKLLRLPKDVKNIDRNRYRQLIGEAAERAEQTYGPKYAKRALQEAIAFQLAGADEEHKQIQAGILRKMVQGEPITATEIGQLADLEKLNRAGLRFGSDALAGLDRLGRGPQFPIAPIGDPTKPAIGQTYQPSDRQVEWLRQNPEGWQVFDQKFGVGSAARVLGSDDPWDGRRASLPKAKPGSREQRAADAVKPKDTGWFGR